MYSSGEQTSLLSHVSSDQEFEKVR
jgi:hypothetical protein